MHVFRGKEAKVIAKQLGYEGGAKQSRGAWIPSPADEALVDQIRRSLGGVEIESSSRKECSRCKKDRITTLDRCSECGGKLRKARMETGSKLRKR